MPTSQVSNANRRIIAVILGMFGLFLLLDLLIISMVQPQANYDGFRQVMIIIVGALLMLGGVLTIVWPSKGTSNQDEQETE